MQISEQLASQHISKSAIADLLYYLGRTKWEKTYNRHELDIKAWGTGIWVKQAGIISYKDLAEFITETTKLRAGGLQVKRLNKNLFLVQGSQQSWYAVHRIDGKYKCECMLYRCRDNRLKTEFPQLFKALNQKIFCHHTIAAYMHIKELRSFKFEYALKCDRSDLLNDAYDSAWCG